MDTRRGPRDELDRAQRANRNDAQMPIVRGRLCHAADRLRNLTSRGEFAPLASDCGLRPVAAICRDEEIARSTHVIVAPWRVPAQLRRLPRIRVSSRMRRAKEASTRLRDLCILQLLFSADLA